jgi:hypothetical protein
MGTTVVAARDCPEPFLTGGIPLHSCTPDTVNSSHPGSWEHLEKLRSDRGMISFATNIFTRTNPLRKKPPISTRYTTREKSRQHRKGTEETLSTNRQSTQKQDSLEMAKITKNSSQFVA